ncbi:hypothetical protein [Naasia lichenicola]|uniref:Uncharacterized protein n=1 Tax=Naasia lichenicola TaxID=2565933 RepID=A0A4S4FQ01_9MICO|nr:hypothetical protein [Naasia lichenicola]THG31675.1 hypothetical protein E6C64_06295 [Naasia lichenicola]
MEMAIAIVGFLGGWLLVAGPIYQAATELGAEAVDRASISAAYEAVPAPAPDSPWWWLVPPVAMWRRQRISRAHHEAMLKVMTEEQVTQLLRFGAKATGWLIVALGAAFIAAKETWELVELLEWRTWTFFALVVAGVFAAVLFMTLRTRRDQQMIEQRSMIGL